MPIEISKAIKRITQKEFHELDEIVLKHVFDIHNSFGRFGDEKMYRNQLKDSLLSSGITSEQEVCIKVSYKDFLKLYFIYLLVMESAIYEFKTVEFLNDSHKQQLIHYLLLTGLNHGQLINFRQPSVTKQFVSTNLNSQLRHRYNLSFNDWDNSLGNSATLKNIMTEVIQEWGAFLNYNLYRDAALYFLGGKEKMIKPVNVIGSRKIVGQQKFSLLNDRTAFHISSISRQTALYENHMRRLLKHVELDTIQWINFDKHNITFKTIQK